MRLIVSVTTEDTQDLSELGNVCTINYPVDSPRSRNRRRDLAFVQRVVTTLHEYILESEAEEPEQWAERDVPSLLDDFGIYLQEIVNVERAATAAE